MRFIDKSIRDKRAKWTAEMKARGHKPKKEGNLLDIFVTSAPGHNGPGCQTCGWSCCWHCKDIADIPVCAKEKKAA